MNKVFSIYIWILLLLYNIYGCVDKLNIMFCNVIMLEIYEKLCLCFVLIFK